MKPVACLSAAVIVATVAILAEGRMPGADYTCANNKGCPDLNSCPYYTPVKYTAMNGNTDIRLGPPQGNSCAKWGQAAIVKAVVQVDGAGTTVAASIGGAKREPGVHPTDSLLVPYKVDFTCVDWKVGAWGENCTVAPSGPCSVTRSVTCADVNTGEAVDSRFCVDGLLYTKSTNNYVYYLKPSAYDKCPGGDSVCWPGGGTTGGNTGVNGNYSGWAGAYSNGGGGGGSSVPAGAIAGGVVGGCVVLAVVGGLVYHFRFRGRRTDDNGALL